MILRRVLRAVVFVCVLSTSSSTGNLPLVINTWTFLNATIAGETILERTIVMCT